MSLALSTCVIVYIAYVISEWSIILKITFSLLYFGFAAVPVFPAVVVPLTSIIVRKGVLAPLFKAPTH